MAKTESSERLYLEFCRLLVQARKKAGLTQEQFAEKLGCGQPRVAKIESGKRRLDIAEFIEISRIIGADPRKIVAKLLAVEL